MAGADNLKGKGFDSRSTEEVREIASRGGINSGISRRHKKELKNSAQMLMELPVGKSLRAKLKQIGIPEEEANYQMGVLVAILQEALQGNVRAATFLRETMGEDPGRDLKKQELLLRQEEFEYRKKQDIGNGIEIEDLSSVVLEIWGHDAWMRMLPDGMPVMATQTERYVFGEKHMNYIRGCRLATYNVAEGAVRAGKTIDNIMAFAYELCLTDDKIHLATGSTMANAKMNIGDANGLGLEHVFRGQCRWGIYKGNDCLLIRGPFTNFTEKIVIFAGGAESNSYKKIRGNSYGLWIATEINLHHDSMIKEAFNRQLAAKTRKIFWDLNPENPNAKIYEEYIDRYAEQEKNGSLIGGYNYEHFTIFDNQTLPKERIAEIVSQYDPESLWYKRDIEGKRSVAEGVIYTMYQNTVETEEREYGKYYISMDYGILNPTAMILWGLCDGVWYAIREYYHSGRDTHDQKTDAQYYEALEALAGDCKVERVIVDPSASSFITLVEQKRKFRVLSADNAVIEGIQHVSQCLFEQSVRFNDCCRNTIKEFGLYRWDEKATEDKPVKENDHAMDAVRYFVQTTGIWRKKEKREVLWLK